MPDVFITLEEAATFESVKYNTLVQRMKRNPEQYRTQAQAQEGGGKDRTLISTSSLSAKARKAWRAAQKVEGSEVIIDKRAQEAVPWYVTADLNQYTEANKKRFYEAVELAARVQDFIDYDGPDRTGYAERYALGLGISPQSLYRYMKNVLEANAWALKLEKEDGKSRDYFRALALCRKPKETGTFPSLTDEQKAIIENIWFDKRFAANLGTIEMLYERFELEAERREWEEYPSIKTVARYIKFLMGQRGAESARFLAANGTREWKNKRMMKGKRDATSLQVMEYVVGDEHTFDFWVQWTAPNGKIKAVRPKLVAWLDMRSRANSVLHSAISVGVVCPDEHNQKFAQFISGLNRQSQAKHNTDYLISFPGFYQAFKTGLDLPDPTSSKWKQITASSERDVHKAAVEFGDSIIRKIDQLSANSIDVILIYIPEEYEVFTSYTDGTINYDLHDYIKAYAAQKQVATQFVREKTIESDLHCQIMWALSLALYVKSGRTPWVVNGIQPDTAFAGIGYSVMNGPSGSNVVVGCSHIYSSDGRGMKYKLSKIQDYSFDRKKNPYLSEEEAYRIGLNIKELFYKSFSELPKRVVIHKRTPFRREEVKGLVESLSSAGVKNIELLEITYEDNLKCFALNERCTQVDGYPVRRGMCFPIDKNTMYLFTHGIAPSVISPKRRYFQGGKSVPLPLKVVKHYGSGDMAQIATEILGLSKMNWNSFGLYSKLPCTIESSNEIARIGWLLSQFEGTLYDYRYFM